MDCSLTNIRRKAFAKLASLSTKPISYPRGREDSDIVRLAKSLSPPKAQPIGFLDGVLSKIAPTSRIPMTIRELDILLALCKAAPSLHDIGRAEHLTFQISSYLPEAQTQLFHSSPFLHNIEPSPWAALTYELTNALLSIGIHHPSLRTHIVETVQSYLNNCEQSAEAAAVVEYEEDEDEEGVNDQNSAETATIAVSLMGFMEAAALHENFWTSFERQDLIRQLSNILSERFLVAVETASSTIRNSAGISYGIRDWRKYLRRYAAKSKPLGAMSLQHGFMRFVLSCTSRLLVNEADIESGDLLDQYIAGTHLERAHDQEIDDEMIEYLVELISDQMRQLEDGADYLQLGSAWQQRLAFSVKAFALEAYLHCMVIDEDIADAEILFSWLEDSMVNQVQMADEQLADIVLKSLAVVAKYIPEGASNIARLLLRFIVSGTSRGPIVEIAAESLSHILRMLSQDAVITTLYSLGNVLSSGSGAEKTHHVTSPSPDRFVGHNNSLTSTVNPKTGSVISLTMSGDEETSLVCGNVIHAIVTIATCCNDSRIVALAQTMLLQKVGKINLLVDGRVLEEAAILAVHGKENGQCSQLRFRSGKDTSRNISIA